MGRKHALAISALLAGCVGAGAAAAMKTVHLGAAAAKPPHVADAVIAAQQAKLDRYAATLEKARKARPPALPRVPHYAPVVIPAPQTARNLASAPASAPKPAAPPPVKYVRPPPIVQTVQAPPQAPPAWSGDDGGGDDGGGD
jgi:hypothetical protein